MNTLLNPALAIGCYALAIGCANLLLRLPTISAIVGSLDAPDRQTAIDGLRGYLAFGVFIHHMVIYYPYLETGVFELPALNFYSQLGRASVALFFMITGFLFWSRVLDTHGRMSWRQFLLGRLFRIYPLYLFALGCVVLIVFAQANWQLQVSGDQLASSLARWLIFQRPDINGHSATGDLIANVSWTLSYELFFYLTLPCWTLIFINRGRWVRLALSLIGIYALYKLMGASSVLKHSVLLSFLGGVAAAYWIRNQRCCEWAQGRIAATVALMALAIVMLGWNTSFALVPLVLLTLFFCIVASGNMLFGALGFSSIRWLGEISYSTYLLHGLVLWSGLVWLPSMLAIDARSPLYRTSFIIIGSLTVIVMSSVSYLVIERWGIKSGRRLKARMHLPDQSAPASQPR
ncbi:acyltransferase family protein [Stutzerimonas stutzeri]|uniref:acyltransferase family protein n=1 Tax=Stutzerimonas stutzeri TaxID=316 RepID=UPI00210E50D6|nr:acyltransferase [Stutzerimonas stutzeri]MCQ4256982.1 acyltransferase [Stutzerimonas stutzeri]